MPSPKISIITVCYNAEQFIERTLRSVIAQTYPDVEYIVVDGASKDNTVALIRQYEPRIARWVSEPDGGIYDAMNKGLRLATGDYVWYMNAGDCLREATTVEDILRQSNGEDFVYGDAVIVTEEGGQRPWHKKKPPDKNLSYKTFINGMVICHQAMMVRRSKAVAYATEPWKVSSDLDWVIRVTRDCRSFRATDLVWCNYLEGGLSAKNRLQSVRERFDICVRHFGIVPTLAEQGRILFQLIRRGRLS
ncbi:MAG: glycosyltransferase [Ferruginibacter sp.]|nr:glycosyltransferase [Cytophagales bacterium]